MQLQQDLQDLKILRLTLEMLGAQLSLLENTFLINSNQIAPFSRKAIKEFHQNFTCKVKFVRKYVSHKVKSEIRPDS